MFMIFTNSRSACKNVQFAQITPLKMNLIINASRLERIIMVL